MYFIALIIGYISKLNCIFYDIKYNIPIGYFIRYNCVKAGMRYINATLKIEHNNIVINCTKYFEACQKFSHLTSSQ